MIPVFWQPEPVSTDFDRVFKYASLWGFDGIELRAIGSPTERVPDVREPALRKRFIESGLTASASDPGLFEGAAGETGVWLNELELLRDVVDFNRRMGIPVTLLGSFESADELPVEQIRKAAGIAGEADQTILIRASDPERLHALVREAADERVFGEWEPQSGETLPEGFVDCVGLVRLREELNEAELEDGLPGRTSQWESCLHLLRDSGFAGSVCLELVTDRAGRVGLATATELIRCVGRIFS